MNRNRYLLCFLICCAMIYYAVPQLSKSWDTSGIFTLSWLLAAIFVLAGNLTSMLYSPKKTKKKKELLQRNRAEQKIRSFYRS